MGIVALVWVLLTTPATTIGLLYLAEHPSSPFHRLDTMLPGWGVKLFVGGLLIGLPAFGTLLGSIAMRRIRASWSPLRGAGYATAATVIGAISTVAAIAIFVWGLL